MTKPRPLIMSLAATAACLALAFEAPASELRFDFDQDATGRPPSGFSVARSGSGAPAARWEAIDAQDAPSAGRVVAQLSDDATGYRFPLLVSDDFVAKDVEIFRVRDRTFDGPGKTGLWTKADSVTWFDDLEVRSLDRGGSSP